MFARWLVVSAVSALALTSAFAEGRNGYSVEIDLEQQLAHLIYGDEVVLTSPISSGRAGFQTKRGRFKVIQKERNHYSNLYGKIVDSRGRTIVADADSDMRVPRGAKFVAAPMPYFIRFNGAEGLHAGYLPGYPASHGCVRLPERNAIAFFNALEVGSPVTVFGTTPTRGRSRQQPDYRQRGSRAPYEDEEEFFDPYYDEAYAPPPPVRWR
jgi:lipoprotein-anchoring transpeptidase ErfK/SrfK